MRDTGLLYPAILLYIIQQIFARKDIILPPTRPIKRFPILYNIYMRGSTKPTIYLIDGLNFIRTFLYGNGSVNEENLTSELISWLDELGSDKLYGSEFRLFLDGSFRKVGPTRTACVQATFTEEYTADELILEQARFYKQYSTRAVVVTSDRELSSRVRDLGIKTLSCSKFFNAFYEEIC